MFGFTFHPTTGASSSVGGCRQVQFLLNSWQMQFLLNTFSKFKLNSITKERIKLTKEEKMSGRGKRRVVRFRRSDKAGVTFPCSKIRRSIKGKGYTTRIGEGVDVYIAAVLEYVATEIFQFAGEYAKDDKRKRIKPKDIYRAIRDDEEMCKLLPHIIIKGGGGRRRVSAPTK